MESHLNDRPAIDRERRVLQALSTADRKVIESAARLLARYSWREPVHQIIFNCLSRLSTFNPVSLRERLAECATRKGFPDIDWEKVFHPNPISGREAEELMRQLLDSDKAEFPDQ